LAPAVDFVVMRAPDLRPFFRATSRDTVQHFQATEAGSQDPRLLATELWRPERERKSVKAASAKISAETEEAFFFFFI